MSSLKRGDRVLLELRTSEVYEGTVEHVSSISIELCDIFCQSTGSSYESNLTFYRNEVVKTSLLTKSAGLSPEQPGPPFGDATKIKMDPDEFDRLKQMTLNFVYVNAFGKSFDDAMKVLQDRESLAVAATRKVSRSKPINLLLVADFKQVFIFDLYCLVELRELKDVLESTFICKVVHGGAALSDCLHHKYNVDMNNVFDTQIIDMMIREEEGGEIERRNISECLAHYFNFPPALLSAAIEDMHDNNALTRPLTKGDKIKASQLVSYLLSLRDLMMSKISSKYMDAVECEYTTFKRKSDSEFLKFRSQKKNT